jgi:hypothetical protein
MKVKGETMITDGQTLKSARYHSGYDIPVYDDGFGPLWIHRNSLGISGIVRAQTWSEAYEICEDEFFPEAEESVEELIKEYGDSWLENGLFQEAYGFRPNGPNGHGTRNHGIYAKDLNGDRLDLLTPRMVEELEIILVIEDRSWPWQPKKEKPWKSVKTAELRLTGRTGRTSVVSVMGRGVSPESVGNKLDGSETKRCVIAV